MSRRKGNKLSLQGKSLRPQEWRGRGPVILEEVGAAPRVGSFQERWLWRRDKHGLTLKGALLGTCTHCFPQDCWTVSLIAPTISSAFSACARVRTHTHTHSPWNCLYNFSCVQRIHIHISWEPKSGPACNSRRVISACTHIHTHTQRVTGIASTISPAFSVHTHIHTSENQSRDLLATAEESSA